MQALNHHATSRWQERYSEGLDCSQEEVDFHEVLQQREMLVTVYEAPRRQVRGSQRDKRSKRMLPFYLLPNFTRLNLHIPLLS